MMIRRFVIFLNVNNFILRVFEVMICYRFVILMISHRLIRIFYIRYGIFLILCMKLSEKNMIILYR